MTNPTSTPDAPTPDLITDAMVGAAWTGYDKRPGYSKPERFRDALKAAVPLIVAALRAERDVAPFDHSPFQVLIDFITTDYGHGGGAHDDDCEICTALASAQKILDAHSPASSPGAPVCKDCTEMFGEPMPCAVPYDPPPKATSPGAAAERIMACISCGATGQAFDGLITFACPDCNGTGRVRTGSESPPPHGNRCHRM